MLEARYPKLLGFSWEIAQEVNEALIPRLLLQPLVENAVKHGALRRRGGSGHVTVKVDLVCDAQPGAERLVCTVEDNGPGLQEPIRDAFGLRAVRRRLELKYGPAGVLHLESTSQGTRATVELPV